MAWYTIPRRSTVHSRCSRSNRDGVRISFLGGHPLRRACVFALAILVCPVLLAGAPAPGPVRLPAGEELRYTLFLGTRQAGRVVFRGEGGSDYVLTFEVSDRGRGQSLTAHMTLDDSGVPSALHVTGVDYWKDPVDERFERKDGRAVWSSSAESGEARPAGPAFYLSQASDLD